LLASAFIAARLLQVGRSWYLCRSLPNIVETDYDRAYHGVNLGETAIEITMETCGPDHIAEIISVLGMAGYSQGGCCRVVV
jgi:hypothetical protein